MDKENKSNRIKRHRDFDSDRDEVNCAEDLQQGLMRFFSRIDAEEMQSKVCSEDEN